MGKEQFYCHKVSSPQLQIPETRDSEYKVMHSTNTLEAHDSSG